MPDAASWLAAGGMPAGVVAGSTLRNGGVSTGVWAANNMGLHVGDDEGAVNKNRQAMQQRVGARAVQWLTQVHGVNVIEASETSAGTAPEADAAWTTNPGIALAIMTADCVPILLADESASIVGAAHAGWQGLEAGVIAALIASMPVAADALCAWIGPAVSQTNYEVGEDVWRRFVERYPDALAAHPSEADKRLLDLTAVAQSQLEAAGVANVMACAVCTYADERCYSHRLAQHSGAGQTGRQASVVMLA